VVVRERAVGDRICESISEITGWAAFFPYAEIKLTRLAINQRAPLAEIRRVAPRGIGVDDDTAVDR
jgi:hypothetical protein